MEKKIAPKHLVPHSPPVLSSAATRHLQHRTQPTLPDTVVLTLPIILQGCGQCGVPSCRLVSERVQDEQLHGWETRRRRSQGRGGVD